MAKIELRDKSYDRDIRTGAHNFHFCKADPPKELDIFAKGTIPGYKDRTIEKDGVTANWNLYVAVRDFMQNSELRVELNKPEEEFYKKVVPEVYEKWLKLNPKQKKSVVDEVTDIVTKKKK
jgi:hypothetical protein